MPLLVAFLHLPKGLPLMLLNSLMHLAQEAGRAVARLPLPQAAPMPVINSYLVAGGAVAAFVVVAKYPTRTADAPRQRVQKRTVVFLLTFLPGVIIAQLAYDILVSQAPVIREIPSLPLGMGAVLGGCGLPVLLSLWKKLPPVLVDKTIGAISPAASGAISPASTPTPSTQPTSIDQPTDPNPPTDEGNE